MDLSSRVVLLTGAKRIGQAVARSLAGRGADIAVTYRSSRAEAEAVASLVQSSGRRSLVVPADLTDESSARTLVATVTRELGGLDILVNMASVYRKVELSEMTDADWRRQLAVDLDGTFRMCQAAVPVMRQRGGGRIINFTDWVAASARPRYKGYLAYYVAKAGVKALTEALALELAADNILVNAVAPGPVLAPDDLAEEERAAVARTTPVGRWGGADEIAKMVVALVESDFVTGETIRVDGGRHVY